MYPVLTKTASKNLILQTAKTVCAHFLRHYSENSNEFELPPEPTTCCMSGCVNCVWIQYAETLAKMMDGNSDQVRQLVLNKIKDPNLKMFLAIELKSIQYNMEQSRNTNQSVETVGKDKGN